VSAGAGRGRALTTAASIALTVAVIAWVALALDWRAARETFAGLSWPWVGAGLGVYLASYALRTLRFRRLVTSQPVAFRPLMGVTSLHGMFNYLLPGRTGEVSYPLLVKRHLGLTLTESTATLVAARFFDFATIGLFLPVVVVVFRDALPGWMVGAAIAFCALVYAGLAAMVLVLRRPPAPAPCGAGVLAGARRAWHGLVEALRAIWRRGQYAPLWALSIAIWLCVYTMFYCIVVALGFPTTLFEMVVVSVILLPVTLIPVQGLANVGTHEVAWIAAFSLFGHPLDVALTVAVSTHFVQLAYVLALGALGLALVGPGR